jgi:hypothetical protein
MSTLLIGVDCAAQAHNTGLAAGVRSAGSERISVLETCCASNETSAARIVAGWVNRDSSERTLLALDAPLGWPAALGEALAIHQAGWPLPKTANEMFRRLTDDRIYERLGRRPLEVAADRIARATHAALCFLEELRQDLGASLELVWKADWPGRFGVIEVYPAATRLALGVPKGRGSLAGLEDRLDFGDGEPPASSEHERDAIVCLVAADEFLSGRAERPPIESMPRVRREGWIWVGSRS